MLMVLCHGLSVDLGRWVILASILGEFAAFLGLALSLGPAQALMISGMLLMVVTATWR